MKITIFSWEFSNIEQILEATPYKAAAVRPLTTHHENYQN